MKSFTPVRDPVTGQIVMVPKAPTPAAPKWGDYGRSDEVRDLIGKERYDAIHPDDFTGEVASVRDVHEVTLVEITALLAPHSPGAAIGVFARNFRGAADMVRSGELRSATVSILSDCYSEDDDNHSKEALIAIGITPHEVTLTMFCSRGDVIDDPICYWNDNGGFAMAPIPARNIDDGMVDRTVQMRRIESTRIALAARRKQAECPEGVIDLMAFRQMRAVRG